MQESSLPDWIENGIHLNLIKHIKITLILRMGEGTSPKFNFLHIIEFLRKVANSAFKTGHSGFNLLETQN